MAKISAPAAWPRMLISSGWLNGIMVQNGRPPAGRRAAIRMTLSLRDGLLPYEEPHHSHSYQDQGESADDGRAGGQIDLQRKVDTQCRDQRAHGPAYGQSSADPIGKEHGAYRGHDQVAEHQQDAGDGDRGRDHEAERGVEQEVPEANIDAFFFGGFGVHRDE